MSKEHKSCIEVFLCYVAGGIAFAHTNPWYSSTAIVVFSIYWTVKVMRCKVSQGS